MADLEKPCLQSLPNEVLQKISSFLEHDFDSLLALVATNGRLRAIATGDFYRSCDWLMFRMAMEHRNFDLMERCFDLGLSIEHSFICRPRILSSFSEDRKRGREFSLLRPCNTLLGYVLKRSHQEWDPDYVLELLRWLLEKGADPNQPGCPLCHRGGIHLQNFGWEPACERQSPVAQLLVLRARQEMYDFPKFISKAFRGAKWPRPGRYSDERWARAQMIEERPIDRMIRLLVNYGAIVPVSIPVRKSCWYEWDITYSSTWRRWQLLQIHVLEQYVAIETPHQTLKFILQQTCTDGRLVVDDNDMRDITAAIHQFSIFFLSSITLCFSFSDWTLSAEESLEQDVEMAFNFLEKLRLLNKYVFDEEQAESLTSRVAADLHHRAGFIGRRLLFLPAWKRDEDEDSGEEDVGDEEQSQHEFWDEDGYHRLDGYYRLEDESDEDDQADQHDAVNDPENEEEPYARSAERWEKCKDGFRTVWLTSVYKKSPKLVRELMDARIVGILTYTGFYEQPSLTSAKSERHYRDNLERLKADCPELFEMRREALRKKVLANPELHLSKVDEEFIQDPADLCDV